MRSREVDAAADGFLFDRANGEVGRQESPLDLGVVGNAGGQAEELLVDVQVDRRLVVRRWHEDALVRSDSRTRVPSARRGR